MVRDSGHRRALTWAPFVVAFMLAALLLSLGSARATGGGTIYTIAGTGGFADGPDGLQGTEAQLDRPRSMFPTSDGGYVWGEPWDNKVRKVGPDGIIRTIAGTGVAGYSGDGGPATAAELNFVHSAAPAPDGSILVADTLNHRIRRIAPDGTITTVAGNGVPGFGGDNGPATQASINNPRGVAPLPDGGFLIPDTGNHRVRRVWPSGIITTVAGTGNAAYSGDGGPATSADLWSPFAVAPTPDGGFLISDIANIRIRKVSPSGVITTVAGNGNVGFSGDGGPATAATINAVHNLAVRSDGSILLADTYNNRVREVTAGGTISTFAGDGSASFGGDGGPATAAQLNLPKAVALDAAGNVYISDEQNSRVRFVGTPVAPANAAAPSVSGTAEQAQTLTATAGGWSGTGPQIAYQWRRCDSSGAGCSDVTGAISKTYTIAGADVGSTMRIRVTASNAAGSAFADSVQTVVVAALAASGTLTFGEAASGDDGDIQVRGPTSGGYPPSGTPAPWWDGGIFSVSRRLVGGEYRIQVGLLRFDTSGLPDGATITSATLKGYVTWTADGDNRNLVGDWYGAWPIDAADWTATAGSSALAGADITAISGNAVNSFALQNVSNVSTTGYTGLRLHVSGGVPAADNLVQFVAWDDLTGKPKPQLVVSYTTTAAPTPPSNTALPTVSGSAQEGQPLTASQGAWSGSTPIAYAYRWRRCDAAGAACADIASATGTTYTLSANDVGSTIRVRVTASNDAGSSFADSTQTTTVTAAPAAPVNTTPPAVSGIAQESQTLTASTGTWTGTAPISFDYRWRRCDTAGSSCSNVTGATASSYTLAAGDVGSTIRVRVTASNAGGSAFADSAATGSVSAAPASPTNTALPSVSGTAQQGQTLTATSGTWTGTAPISYAYQWRRCDAGGAGCTDIFGGTASTYVPVVTDVGATLRARVTASNSAGSSFADSAPTAVVTAPPTAPSNTGLPTISGSAQSGQTLTGSSGSWSGSAPISFAYQWRRCDSGGAGCADLSGATGSSYVVVSGDVGSTVRVRVTASNAGGSAFADSAQTAVVTAGQVSATLTFDEAASGDDGDIQVRAATSGGYPPSGTPAPWMNGNIFTVARRLTGGEYRVQVGLLRFDTSALPDGATITSATLKGYVTRTEDGDNRSLVGEWYGAWPIDAADWTATAGSSALAGADITGISVNAVNSFALQSVSSVSTTGFTGLRLHVSGGVPLADNLVQFAAWDDPSSKPKPQLVVTYTVP